MAMKEKADNLILLLLLYVFILALYVTHPVAQRKFP